MYVCVCNEVTLKAIRDEIKKGSTTFEALQDKLGCSTTCGTCMDEVLTILEKENAEQ